MYRRRRETGGKRPEPARERKGYRKGYRDRATSSSPCGAVGPFDFFMTEAGDEVVIHHAHGLHEGIADRRADEFETAADKVFAHPVRFRRVRRHLRRRTPGAPHLTPANELPDVCSKTAAFLPDRH